MEFEDLDEEQEWEVRRVAAAFRMKNWSLRTPGEYVDFEGTVGEGEEIEWKIVEGRVVHIKHRQSLGIRCFPDGWALVGHPDDRVTDLITCGVYCLGIEEEGVLEQLPPLSVHEKLELRLSLPREFWPKTWLDETDAL